MWIDGFLQPAIRDHAPTNGCAGAGVGQASTDPCGSCPHSDHLGVSAAAGLGPHTILSSSLTPRGKYPNVMHGIRSYVLCVVAQYQVIRHVGQLRMSVGGYVLGNKTHPPHPQPTNQPKKGLVTTT